MRCAAVKGSGLMHTPWGSLTCIEISAHSELQSSPPDSLHNLNHVSNCPSSHEYLVSARYKSWSMPTQSTFQVYKLHCLPHTHITSEVIITICNFLHAGISFAISQTIAAQQASASNTEQTAAAVKQSAPHRPGVACVRVKPSKFHPFSKQPRVHNANNSCSTTIKTTKSV